MKKIIKGKVYDTETARELATYANGGTWRDFNHLEETLYRKKTGEYFLFGEGGPATRYAEATGQNSWSGGSRIMPMTYQEATAWAEKHLDGDEYEEIFGAVVEDDTKKAVTYNLTITAIEKVRRIADEAGRTVSDVLEEIIGKA